MTRAAPLLGRLLGLSVHSLQVPAESSLAFRLPNMLLGAPCFTWDLFTLKRVDDACVLYCTVQVLDFLPDYSHHLAVAFHWRPDVCHLPASLPLSLQCKNINGSEFPFLHGGDDEGGLHDPVQGDVLPGHELPLSSVRLDLLFHGVTVWVLRLCLLRCSACLHFLLIPGFPVWVVHLLPVLL